MAAIAVHGSTGLAHDDPVYRKAARADNNRASRALPGANEPPHFPVELPDWLPVQYIPVIGEVPRIYAEVRAVQSSRALRRTFAREASLCERGHAVVERTLASLPHNSVLRALVQEHRQQLEHAATVLNLAVFEETFKEQAAVLELASVATTVVPWVHHALSISFATSAMTAVGSLAPVLLLCSGALNIAHHTIRHINATHANTIAQHDPTTSPALRDSLQRERLYFVCQIAFWVGVSIGILAASGLVVTGALAPGVGAACLVAGVTGSTILSTLWGQSYTTPRHLSCDNAAFVPGSLHADVEVLLSAEKIRHVGLQRSLESSMGPVRRTLLTALRPVQTTVGFSHVVQWQIDRHITSLGAMGRALLLETIQASCEARLGYTQKRLAAVSSTRRLAAAEMAEHRLTEADAAAANSALRMQQCIEDELIEAEHIYNDLVARTRTLPSTGDDALWEAFLSDWLQQASLEGEAPKDPANHLAEHVVLGLQNAASERVHGLLWGARAAAGATAKRPSWSLFDTEMHAQGAQ